MPLLSNERSVISLSTMTVSFWIVTTLLLATWKKNTKQTSFATYKSKRQREETFKIILFDVKVIFKNVNFSRRYGHMRRLSVREDLLNFDSFRCFLLFLCVLLGRLATSTGIFTLQSLLLMNICNVY